MRLRFSFCLRGENAHKNAPDRTVGSVCCGFGKDPYFMLSATATAQATVIPTMGLLPAPRKPIIST